MIALPGSYCSTPSPLIFHIQKVHTQTDTRTTLLAFEMPRVRTRVLSGDTPPKKAQSTSKRQERGLLKKREPGFALSCPVYCSSILG